MPPWFWPTVVGCATTFVGFVIVFCTWVVTQINGMKVRLAENKVQIAPLSMLIEKSLMGLLHHDKPECAEPDALIDEYRRDPEKFPQAKRARLDQLMQQRAVADVPELEQERAKALISFMRIVVIEKKTLADKVGQALLGIFLGTSLAYFRYWHK